MTTDSQAVETMAPPLVLARLAPGPDGKPSRLKSTALSLLTRHWLLLSILVIQAALTVRLSNTAFNDEALYLNVGHAEIARLLGGAATPNFAASLSGSPFIYPVLASSLDSLGGLELVRGLSTLFMLVTTMLVFGFTRRLFSWSTAIVAAATFWIAPPILFIGHLATFDALTVLLLALATWLVVLGAQERGGWGWTFALAAGLAAGFAGLTKYAGLLYIPPVLATGVLVATRSFGLVRALRRMLLPFALGVGGLLGAVVASAPQLLVGLRTTTTQRQLGSAHPVTIIADTALYTGGMLLLAVAGALVLMRNHAPLEQRLLGFVLAATGFLAPLVQLRLHTTVSLQKHAGFGLVFAAPLVGVALIAAMTRWRRKMLVPLIAIFIIFVSLGANTSQSLFAEWPNTTNLLQVLQTRVQRGNAHYLVEEGAVAQYYFAPRTDPTQWISTYYFEYREPDGSALTGPAAFEAGISHGYFEIVALSNGPTKSLDLALERAIERNPRYREIADLRYTTSFGPGRWRVWQRQ